MISILKIIAPIYINSSFNSDTKTNHKVKKSENHVDKESTITNVTD